MNKGRPKKENADYFSHDADASEKKTVSILENHFGAEGYSAWFKLLEQLTKSNGHYINISSAENFEFLAQKIKLLPQKLRLILDKLADLSAIDNMLYVSGYIWSQSLVDRLKPVYEKRGLVPPTPPLYIYNTKVKESQLLVPENDLSVPENTLPSWNYCNLLPPGYSPRPPFPFKDEQGREFDYMAVDKAGNEIALPPLPSKDREHIPVIVLTMQKAPPGERYADLMLDVPIDLFYRAYQEGFIRETDKYINGLTDDESEFYYFTEIPGYLK